MVPDDPGRAVDLEEQLRRRSAARAASFAAVDLLLAGIVELDQRDFGAAERALCAAQRTLTAVTTDLCQRGSLA